MRSLKLTIEQKLKIETLFIVFTILFFILRLSLPSLLYPFLATYLFICCYFTVYYRKMIFLNIKSFLFNYYLIFILLFILVISFFTSHKFYLLVFKDIFNIIILLSLFYLLDLIISEIQQIKYIYSILKSFFLITAIIISIFGFFTIFDVFSFEDLIFRNSTSYVPADNSITYDYNFAILPVFFGLIIILNSIPESNNNKKHLIYSFLFVLFSARIFFSGSRRGFILLIVYFCFLILLFWVFLVQKKFREERIPHRFAYYFLFLSVFIFINYIFIVHTSSHFKNRTFYSIGTKDQNVVRGKIVNNLLRTLYFLNTKISFDSLYNKIWNPVFDSKDPFSGWGRGSFRTEFPLTGENVEIVPAGSIGYRLDSTCLGGDTSHAYFACLIRDSLIFEGDSVYSSVYCYVSKTFDGNVVAIETDNNECGRKTTEYDYSRKGTWQKLELKFTCKSGKVPVYLYINKSGVNNFSSLKGFVIYAYPEYRIIKNNTVGYLAIKNRENLFLSGSLKTGGFFSSGDKLKSHRSIKPLISNPILLSSIINEKVNLQSVIYFQDPLRKWASGLLKEDTTYYDSKDLHFFDFGQHFDNDNRPIRWKFAWQIFVNEYNLTQKIFGGGFNFLNWYGFYFFNDKTKSDYPHNPFMHILLYSGLIGLIFYIFLLFKVFYYYIKYIKEFYMFFIFFMITYYFTFFSGGNPFDPPIMGFFMILPFFIHSIHKKEEHKKLKT
jgi:hypothetical protein